MYLNEKLMVFINNDGYFKRFFGIELVIQKAKHFLFFRQYTHDWPQTNTNLIS